MVESSNLLLHLNCLWFYFYFQSPQIQQKFPFSWLQHVSKVTRPEKRDYLPCPTFKNEKIWTQRIKQKRQEKRNISNKSYFKKLRRKICSVLDSFPFNLKNKCFVKYFFLFLYFYCELKTLVVWQTCVMCSSIILALVWIFSRYSESCEWW